MIHSSTVVGERGSWLSWRSLSMQIWSQDSSLMGASTPVSSDSRERSSLSESLYSWSDSDICSWSGDSWGGRRCSLPMISWYSQGIAWMQSVMSERMHRRYTIAIHHLVIFLTFEMHTLLIYHFLYVLYFDMYSLVIERNIRDNWESSISSLRTQKMFMIDFFVFVI